MMPEQYNPIKSGFDVEVGVWAKRYTFRCLEADGTFELVKAGW